MNNLNESTPVDELTESRSAKEISEIRCVGVDFEQHVCEADKMVTKCGVNVKRKRLLPNDGNLKSCYACTY